MTTPLTTTEAADLSGFARSTICGAILRRKLPATKRGRDWLIDPEDLEKWAKTAQHKSGRPRVSK